MRAVLSPAVPPHHNITVRLEPGESWKIDGPQFVCVNVQCSVESDRFDISSEVKSLSSVDIVTDSSPCSRLLPLNIVR